MTAIRKLSRRLRGVPVELPAALLAATAVAFWLLIAPSSWFQQQLGLFASSARALLGDGARALLALAGFALTFALTLAGLRALEPRRAASADMPRFYKADLHPDAPRRRPIRAHQELGAPELEEVFTAPSLGIAHNMTVPLPSFLQPPATDIRNGPIRFVDDIVRDVPDGVVVQREPIWFRPRDPEPVDESAWEEADWEEASDDPPAPELEREPAVRADVSAEPAPSPDETSPPVAPVTTDENVERLMARLELGLSRRGNAPVRPPCDNDARAALRVVADELNAIFPVDLSPRARAAR